MLKKIIFTILTLFLFTSLNPVPTLAQSIGGPGPGPGPKPTISIILNPADIITNTGTVSFNWQVEPEDTYTGNLDFSLIIAKKSNLDDLSPDDWLQDIPVGTNTFTYTLTGDQALAPEQLFYWWVIMTDDASPFPSLMVVSNTGTVIVEQEPPQIDPLILQYEPILYFHPNEDFYPMNIDAFVNNSSLWDSQGAQEDQILKPETDNNPVALTDLTPEGVDTSDWYLQFSQNLTNKTPDPDKARAEYQQLVSSQQAQNTYYARKMEDSYVDDNGITHNFIVLQYWYFYGFNDWRDKVGGLASNNHEGDWETVMVFLDKATEEPEYVAYSAHHNIGEESLLVGSFDSVRRSWASSEVVKTEGKIVSFVGLGSHANYPNNGKNGVHKILTLLFPDDQTSNLGIHLGDESNQWLEENVFVFNENNLPAWLFYQGKWGVDYPNDFKERFSGPKGPSQQDKFNNPIKWAGIDKIKKQQLQSGENTIQTDTTVLTITTNEQGQITVDYHQEIPPLVNTETQIFLPGFWDITSNLNNDTFQAQVQFQYNPEHLDALNIPDPSLLTVFVYNETGQIWEQVPSTVDTSTNTIKFNTTHFSRYAIGINKWQDITGQVKIIKDKGLGGHIKRIIKKSKKFLKDITHWPNKKRGLVRRVRVKNKSTEEIKGQLRLVIDSINQQDITIKEPDGYTTNDNKPYFDITGTYPRCRFIGSQEEIKEILDKKDKKRFRRFLDLKPKLKNKLKNTLQKRGMPKALCDRLIKAKPEITPYIEYFLPPKRITKPQFIEFVSTDDDQNKPIKFDFEVRVLNRVVE